MIEWGVSALCVVWALVGCLLLWSGVEVITGRTPGDDVE
jgi:hypothetical protein